MAAKVQGHSEVAPGSGLFRAEASNKFQGFNCIESPLRLGRLSRRRINRSAILLAAGLLLLFLDFLV
jgi:hypothetical protein